VVCSKTVGVKKKQGAAEVDKLKTPEKAGGGWVWGPQRTLSTKGTRLQGVTFDTQGKTVKRWWTPGKTKTGQGGGKHHQTLGGWGTKYKR